MPSINVTLSTDNIVKVGIRAKEVYGGNISATVNGILTEYFTRVEQQGSQKVEGAG